MMRTTLTLAAACLAVTTISAGPQRAGSGGAAQAEPLPGDPSTGKALIVSSKCLDCHRIADTGSRVGPDLSVIGGSRSPEQIRQAIIAPDDDVPPEDRYARIVTKDGATTTGRLLNQDTFTIQVITDKEELKTFSRANLREYAILDKGLMPSYQGKLTPAQIDDIVSYLSSLRPVFAGRGGRQ